MKTHHLIFEINKETSIRLFEKMSNTFNNHINLDSGVYFISFYNYININDLANKENLLLKNNYSKLSQCEINKPNSITEIYLDDKQIFDSVGLKGFKLFIKLMRPTFLKQQTEQYSDEMKEKIQNDYAKIYSLIFMLDEPKILETSLVSSDFQFFNNHLIYTAIGYQGFVLTNLNAFNKAVSNNKNLIESFTTTELADNMLNNGEMIISWGLTPYQYFIGFKENIPDFITDPKYRTKLKGTYRINSSYNRLSLIKGELLENWDQRNNIDFPILDVPEVEKVANYHIVDFDLYVIDTSNDGFDISPVCFIILSLHPSLNKSHVQPALNFNIFEKNFI